MTARKGFAPVVIVLVIALVAATSAAGYFYYQSQNTDKGSNVTTVSPDEKAIPQTSTQPEIKKVTDETVNWKTATSTDGGYTIKYPPTWLETNAVFFGPTKDLLGIGDSGKAGLISISKTVPPYTVDKEIELYKEHNFSDYKQIDTKVGGAPAVKLSGISQLKSEGYDFRGAKFIVYLVNKTDHVIVITYAQPKEVSDYSTEFEKMVSTIKFLD